MLDQGSQTVAFFDHNDGGIPNLRIIVGKIGGDTQVERGNLVGDLGFSHLVTIGAAPSPYKRASATHLIEQ